jgi:mRNA interferase MazF
MCRGHAQTGDRPALIIQNDSYSAALQTVLIVPFTGAAAAARFPGTVRVQPDGRNGLTVPSVALVFQARSLDKRFFMCRLGVIDPAVLGPVLAVLGQMTN